MLKRIKDIKNIGTLADVHVPKCEFNKFTIVYGGNSHGKSTLCDIFASLKENNYTAIEKRRTVNSTDSPLISLSFSDSGHEIDVRYKDQHWLKGTFDEKFEIFDTNFVHRNVFTDNSNIDQSNRENLTEFIIGEEAVALAKTLQKLNDEKIAIDRERKNLEGKISKSGFSVDELLKIKYKYDITSEDTLCLAIQTDIANQRRNKDNLDIIKKLPLPQQYAVEFDVCEFERINRILVSSFSFEAEDLLEKFNEHKLRHFSITEGADDWLQKGTEYGRNGICPFCGQSVTDNELISSYLVIFSNQFKAYNNSVNNLRLQKIDLSYLERLQLTAEKNKEKIANLCNKLLDVELVSIKDKILSLTEGLIKTCVEYSEMQKNIHSLLESKIEQKKSSKYSSIQAVDLMNLVANRENLKSELEIVNELIEEFCKLSQVALANLSIASIDEKIKGMEVEFTKLDKIIKRNKFNDEIEEYKRLETDRKKNREEERRKKEEFDAQQKSFLDSFFGDIEKYYSLLGSCNYTIGKEEITKGIKKTYSLKLSYKGKLIQSSDIKYVLSESDKRALALAIFLSKLKHSKSSQTIVVLDDPISSFDIDRMQAFTNILKEFYDDLSQIIVLTHYRNFYKLLAGWSSRYIKELSLLKITCAPNSNSFISVDREEDRLLMDEFQERLYEIVSFIEGKTQNYHEVAARVFMEKYIAYYFMLEIRERGIQYSSLDNLLQNLSDNGLINKEIYKKLDIKREEYNSPAHQFDSATVDAKRNSLRDLYDLLHQI